jgi:hypothetical protein
VYDEKVSVNTAEANVIASEDLLVHRTFCHMNSESEVRIIEREDCLKAKFTRLPYKDSSTPRSDPGLRLFGDIQGKFPESFSGKIYSFPLLDDGSGLIIPTFLSLKSEASKTLQFVVDRQRILFASKYFFLYSANFSLAKVASFSIGLLASRIEPDRAGSLFFPTRF